MNSVIERGTASTFEQPCVLDADSVGDGTAIVARPRLLQAVCRGVQGPLTMLAAPPGYGKRVLVRQWAAQHAVSPVASLVLRHDDGAANVAAKLLAAAARLTDDVDAPTLACVPESDSVVGQSFSDALAEWLAPIGDAVLVVEAIDVPRRVALVNELSALLGQLPPNIHVVVTSRSWSPMPLRRLAGRRQAVALDARDLSFTPGEAQLLVRRMADVELTDRQLEALVLRSEGWAVAVKVAAISLRGGSDPDSVIDSLRGTERHIAAFLRDEVLDCQPPAVRRFVVRASVLDTMNPSLCRAVTGERASGLMLRHLELGGTLTRRSAGEDLSVHNELVRDFLRQELRRTAPGAEADLLSRAAAWHVRHGEPGVAASYLIEAEEWDGLIELVDVHGRFLFERGRGEDMLRWLEHVPLVHHDRTRVALRRAYIHTMLGDSRRADQMLREVDPREQTTGEQLVGNVLRAMWAFTDAMPQSALDAADAALRDLNGGVVRVIPNVLGLTSRADLMVMAAGSRARALWQLGDTAGSRAMFTALAHQRDMYRPWRVHVLSALALIEAWAGNLRIAQQHARQASALATTGGLLEHPAMLDSYIAMALVSRERGDLARADKFLNKGGGVAVRTRRPVTIAIHAAERALWHLAGGQPERGLAEIRAIRASGEAPPPPMVDDRLRAVEAQLLLALGATDQAERVVGFAPRPFLPSLSCAAVQVAVARHDLVSARKHLDAWDLGDAERRSRLEHELWTAIVDFEAGRRRDAIDRGIRVVVDAETDDHLRLFLDGGRPAEHLLRAVMNAEPTRYVRSLVQAAGAHVTLGAPVGLSQRELEVVRYLPTSLSSAEIAARLYISLNTLKTHLRTIYRKLAVSSRRDAIARAEELGIA